jgi:polysaccharide biosynthesis protein PslJ
VHVQASDLMSRDGLLRVTSTAAQPLEFSAVLAMCLPLAIHQARHASGSRRAVRWLQVAVIAAGIPTAVSRSVIISLAVMVAILLPSWPRRLRHSFGILLVAGPVAAWLVMPGVVGRFLTAFTQLPTDSSTYSRANALALAVPLIGHHPFFGQGLGTFFPQARFFIDDQFVTTLIETGFTGLAALLALFACGWYAARRARLAAPDAVTADLARSLVAAIAVAAVSFATFDVLSFPMVSGLFFLILGCAGAAWRLTRGAVTGGRPAAPPAA